MATNDQNFSNNVKTNIIKTVVYANTPYLKKAVSYVPESQMKDKKLGNKYKVYIPDPGKTRIVSSADGKDGLQAQIDPINEVEYEVVTKAGLNDCELTEWNKIGDVESWSKQIAQPRGKSVARTVEKEAIDATVFRASQAIVSTIDLDAIGDASAALDLTGAVGEKVTFIYPTVGSRLAKKALGAFNQSDIAKDLYKDKFLGRYAESSVVTESYMPIVNGDSAASATISLTSVSAKGEVIGFEPVNSVTTTAPKGTPFKVEGLKLVDKNGIQTDADYVIILEDDNGKIPELRIELEGKACNNANAWVATGTNSLTLTPMLVSGKKYAVTQTRLETAVGFDSYKFAELPGTKSTTEEIDSPIEVQVYEGGDISTFTSMVRIVVPFAVGLPDPRESVLSYIEIA